MCCYDFRTTKIFEKLASFARLVGPFLLVCIPSYSNYYFGHALMQPFLYLFCVSGIHGKLKTKTKATKFKIPNTNISSDEDLSDDNSPSIIYYIQRKNDLKNQSVLRLMTLRNSLLVLYICQS